MRSNRNIHRRVAFSFIPKRRRNRPMYPIFAIIGIVVVALAVINFIG